MFSVSMFYSAQAPSQYLARGDCAGREPLAVRQNLSENLGVLATCSRVMRDGPQPVLVLLRIFLDFLERHGQRFAQCVSHILRCQCQHKGRLIIVRRAVPEPENPVLHAFGGDEPEWLRHGLVSRSERKASGIPWPHAHSLVSALVNSSRSGPRESISLVNGPPDGRLAPAARYRETRKYP